jgi:hypothetical protein
MTRSAHMGFGGGISEPLITVPEVVPTLGLVLFVYSMGVSSVRASRPRCTSSRLRIMACSEASP